MDRTQRYRNALFAMVIGLLVQFLLGMAVNLFVKIPTDHPGSNPPEYFGGVVQSVGWALLHGHLLLILHAAWGLLLVLNGVALFVQARGLGRRGLSWATGLGGFFVLGAGFNGGSFLNYHEDFSSMIMAGFFALAVAAYAQALFQLSATTKEIVLPS